MNIMIIALITNLVANLIANLIMWFFFILDLFIIDLIMDDIHSV
jgi:hypothetical protein